MAGKHVLLVEDEYFIADNLSAALSAAGAKVCGPAPTIGLAFDIIHQNPHLDGAVLDIRLRNEMVYPLAHVLTAQAVPFVFTTGYDASHIPEAYQYVVRWQKPVDPRKVVQTLAALM